MRESAENASGAAKRDRRAAESRSILITLGGVFLSGWVLVWLFVVVRGGVEYLLQPGIPFYSLGKAGEGLAKGQPDGFFVTPLVLFLLAFVISALAIRYRRGTTIAVVLILLYWCVSCFPFMMD